MMNHKKNTIAVVFAGGKSSRMGKDKALLPFSNHNSLAEYQYRRLSKIFDRVYISAKSDKFDFDVNIIEDCYADSSPLVALISIFETLDVDEVFILSVDAPFVTEDIIDKLYTEAKESSVAIIAESNHGLEPLCGIYRRIILKKAKEALALNRHRLVSLLDEVDGQKVKIDDRESFMNLNHPFEYEEAMIRI
jgi:molybdopterin-guanine dinucleotide biosynthesis protein A